MVQYNEVTIGTEGGNYPPELLKNIRPDDEVMAFIDIVGKERGCLRKKSKNTGDRQFIAITRERVVGTVLTVETDGGFFNKVKSESVSTINIPLVKVTSIETGSNKNTTKGCLSKSKDVEYYLILNAQGGDLKIKTGPDSRVNDEFVKSFLEVSDYF